MVNSMLMREGDSLSVLLLIRRIQRSKVTHRVYLEKHLNVVQQRPEFCMSDPSKFRNDTKELCLRGKNELR